MQSSTASAQDKLLTAAGRAAIFGDRDGAVPLYGPDSPLVAMRGKKVLVTGATGMIGRVICAALKAFGDIKVVEADSSWGIMECLKVNAPFVIHAAGSAEPSRFLAAPMDTIDVAVNWTAKLARALPKSGRMIFLSSSEVYSGSPRQRHAEDDIGQTGPAHLRGCYIEGKRCGEAVVHAARAAGKQVTAARVSLSYGPGVKIGDTRVLNQFITEALKGGRIVLQDGGQARRTYCYVSDTVELLLRILMTGREAVYNVGGEGETTILSLARRIAAQMKDVEVKVPRGMGAANSGAPAHVSLDMSRTKQEFKKFRFVPLETGLADTIAWHRALQGIEVEETA